MEGIVGTIDGDPADRRRLPDGDQAWALSAAGTPATRAADRRLRLRRRRPHGAARVPRLAARGGLRLPRRQRPLPLRDQAGRRSCASGSREVTAFLLDRGAKLLVVACNSAAAAAADAVREIAAERGVEVVTVIEPEAEIAAAITENGRVGVLATPATVEGGAYRRALARQGRGARGDRGRGARPGADHPARLPVRRGRRRHGALLLRAAAARGGIDTLILGCTHYPLVAPMLQRILGRDVRLVTAGHAVAAAAQRLLEARGLASDRARRGRLPLPLHRRRRGVHRARHPLPADAARRPGRARRGR